MKNIIRKCNYRFLLSKDSGSASISSPDSEIRKSSGSYIDSDSGSVAPHSLFYPFLHNHILDLDLDYSYSLFGFLKKWVGAKKGILFLSLKEIKMGQNLRSKIHPPHHKPNGIAGSAPDFNIYITDLGNSFHKEVL